MNFVRLIKRFAKRGWSSFNTWRKNNKKVFITACIVLFVVFVGVDEAITEHNMPETVPYQEFVETLEAGDIDTIYYDSSAEEMRYTLHNAETRGMDIKKRAKYKHDNSEWRITTYPAGEDFRKEVLETGTQIKVKSFVPFSEKVIALGIGLAIPLLVLIWLFKQLNNRFGEATDNKDLITRSDVRFKDVIGHDEVIKDLEFIVNFMKHPEIGAKLNAKIPRGMLFSGDPGTGKTLLAKAIAGESGVPFLYVNASSIIELFVGTGARRIRAIFKKAREVAPCVVFFDEIDAIGVERGIHGSNTEDTQTLNALLQEMDGFDTKSGVFIIAATNRAKDLDSALRRSGRFDREVIVPPPKDWRVRAELFRHYLTPKGGNARIMSYEIDNIAKQTIGFTGADVEAVVNEAKLIAISSKSEFLLAEHIEEAIDKHLFKGNRTRKSRNKHDIDIVAVHEAGHAVMTYLLEKPIARISIIGTTSGVGGMVMQQEGNTQFLTKSDCIAQMLIACAGRCAEKLAFGEVTAGAASDITQMTEHLKRYIGKLGFDQNWGMVDMSVLMEGSLSTSEVFIKSVSDMSKHLEEVTTKALELNFGLVERLANRLVVQETMSGAEVENLFKGMEIKRFNVEV